MKKWMFLLFLPCMAQATSNLISTDTWSEPGDYKMAREDYRPFISGAFCSSCTINPMWDGTTINLQAAKGEILTWVTYLHASLAGDASNVMVKISSFTGTGTAAGSGFAAVAVSSSNVWDYSTRPYSLVLFTYLHQAGMQQVDQCWDPSEYDSNQLPPRWQRPSTCNPKNQCVPNGGTGWIDRQDHDKFYPDPAVPMEEFSISSFTVFASSSQAIGGEVYVSTALPSGTYTAHLDIYESGTLIRTVPISLIVYNVTLPAVPSLAVLVNVPLTDPAGRIDGERNPSDYFVDPYLTTMLRIGAFLHRKKLAIIGDVPPHTHDYPSIEFQKFMDGTAFTETYGLSPNTGPGYGTPQQDYWIGTYGSWQSANWSTTFTGGANGYCTNVSSWTAYCVNNNKRCKLYTSNDEADAATLAGIVNQLATWSSTAPACAFSGNTLPFLQTGDLPVVASVAPAVTSVASTAWLGVSSDVWVTDEALYQNSSSYTVGGYNSGLGVDSILTEQEEGLGPREVMWGAYKTHQTFWFLWNGVYWNDVGNPGGGSLDPNWNANAQNENNILNVAKNFGLDVFPSTDAVRGHYNTASSFSHFANGDGNFLYPGTDKIYTGSSYGFDGVIGSWRLNMTSRGVQDVDIITLAAVVDPVATAILVNNMVQDVMYLRGCADPITPNNCTFYYGPRPWSESLWLWETTREALLQIAAGAPVNPPVQIIIDGSGTISGSGTIFASE